MFLALLLTLFVLAGCSGAPDVVEKPGLVREGAKGPLAMSFPPGVTAPEYHYPEKYWAVRHGDLMRETQDFGLRECMLCHEAATSCDRCHRYVGAPTVSMMPGGGLLPKAEPRMGP
jgi:hypothetical protein